MLNRFAFYVEPAPHFYFLTLDREVIGLAVGVVRFVFII
jgi:hypothetical protein